jgi:ankyrin repeat protein
MVMATVSSVAYAKPEYSALAQAIYDHKTAAGLQAIENGSDVNELIVGRQPIIMAAANFGETAIVRALIRKGANVNALDAEGENVLTMTPWISRDETAMVKMFIEAGIDVNFRSQAGGNSALVRFAGSRAPNVDVVRLLIDAGANIKRDGAQALVTAAANNRNPQLIKMLLTAGASANAIARLYGNLGTPLMALASGTVSRVDDAQQSFDLLLDAGADPNLTLDFQEFNKSAVEIAASDHNLLIFEMLVKSGAEFDAKVAKQVLTNAAELGNLAVAKIALGKGIDPNQSFIPLHHAAGRGDLEMVKLLIAHGADVNQHSPYNGSTPLHYAAGYNMKQISENGVKMTKLLLAYGANPNFVDKFRFSVLMQTAHCKPERGDEAKAVEIVKVLLGAGADKNFRDDRRHTALDYANLVNSGNADVIEALSH